MRYKIYIGEKLNREELLKENLGNIDFEILKTENGKPYIDGNPIYFSISHSKSLEVMVIGDNICSIDIEYIVDRDYLEISNRMFNLDEIEYIKENGIEAFYEIWTKMECYSKLTDQGVFSKRPSLMSTKVEFNGNVYHFDDLSTKEYKLIVLTK